MYPFKKAFDIPLSTKSLFLTFDFGGKCPMISSSMSTLHKVGTFSGRFWASYIERTSSLLGFTHSFLANSAIESFTEGPTSTSFPSCEMCLLTHRSVSDSAPRRDCCGRAFVTQCRLLQALYQQPVRGAAPRSAARACTPPGAARCKLGAHKARNPMGDKGRGGKDGPA